MEASLAQDLEIALSAAREGSRAIRRGLGRIQETEFKGEVDPVTAVDRESEAHIVATVKAVFPDDAILAEEA
ncbi:MAG: inositol monophosphatase family protein, partial [Acidimicrobiia bacterium]